MSNTDYFKIALEECMKRGEYSGWGGQTRLATKAAVDPGYFNKILSGEKKGGEKTRQKIAEALGLAYDEILAMGRQIEMQKQVDARVKAEDEAYKDLDFHLAEEREHRLLNAILHENPQPGNHYVVWLDGEKLFVTNSLADGGDATYLVDWDWQENDYDDYDELNMGLELWLSEQFAHGSLLSPFGKKWLNPLKSTPSLSLKTDNTAYLPLTIERAIKEDKAILRLLEMTAAVLSSETSHAGALRANIESFYEAIIDKKDKSSLEDQVSRIDEQMKKMQAKLEALEEEEKKEGNG